MSYQTDTSEEPEESNSAQMSNSTSSEDSSSLNSISSESQEENPDTSNTEDVESYEAPESSETSEVDDTSSEELPVPRNPKKLFEKPQTTQPIRKGTKKLLAKPVAIVLESYPGETTVSRAYLDQASELVAENYSMVPFADNLIRSAVNYKLYHSRYYMNLNTNAKNISQELSL